MLPRQIQICRTDYSTIPYPCEVGMGQNYPSKSPMYLYAVVLPMSFKPVSSDTSVGGAVAKKSEGRLSSRDDMRPGSFAVRTQNGTLSRLPHKKSRDAAISTFFLMIPGKPGARSNTAPSGRFPWILPGQMLPGFPDTADAACSAGCRWQNRIHCRASWRIP